MSTSVAAGCNGTMQVYGFGLVLITGSFALDVTSGNAGLTVASIKGKGWACVNTSAGLYTITFTRSALSVISCWAQAQIGSAVNVDMYLQVGVVDVVTALTATLQCKTGATNTDPPAANANNRAHFGFLMATSSLNS